MVWVTSVVMVDVHNIPLVGSPVRIPLLDLLLLPLQGFVREPAPGHLLHQGLGGSDGDPVAVVYWNVEESASPGWITLLQCPGLE